MEHRLWNAGLSIDSVPDFQYWKWRLCLIVGCRRSRWVWWQLYRWVVCCLSWAWTYVRVTSRVSWVWCPDEEKFNYLLSLLGYRDRNKRMLGEDRSRRYAMDIGTEGMREMWYVKEWKEGRGREITVVQSNTKVGNQLGWGVGYMDVVEDWFDYRNATKIFLAIFDLEKIFHTSQY
jgi:hypothetical protein